MIVPEAIRFAQSLGTINFHYRVGTEANTETLQIIHTEIITSSIGLYSFFNILFFSFRKTTGF